jgi:hypothetical protein
MAYQEERRCVLQGDTERKAARQQGKLTSERAAVEARLDDLHHCESALKADRATTTNRELWHLSSFTRAS